ncbi:MAG: hypothetical protein QG635_1678, partial [Bacteroidota bacterium]|nr:hypothetical protein [Bacteroidota bacterium]
MKTKYFLIVISFFLIPQYFVLSRNFIAVDVTAPIMDVKMVDTASCFIVGAFGRIIFTQDGGETFEALEPGYIGNFVSVDFIDKNNGIVVSDMGMALITHDMGRTWEKSLIDNNFSYGYIRTTDSKTAFAISFDGILYKTLDFGKNWYKLYEFSDTKINGMKFLDSQTGYVWGDHGLLSKTTDGGMNWTDIFLRDIDKRIFNFDIYENNGIVLGSNMGGSIGNSYKTMDGGETWGYDSVLSSYKLIFFIMIDENRIIFFNRFGRYLSEDFCKSLKYDSLNNRYIDYEYNYFYKVSVFDSKNIFTVGE